MRPYVRHAILNVLNYLVHYLINVYRHLNVTRPIALIYIIWRFAAMVILRVNHVEHSRLKYILVNNILNRVFPKYLAFQHPVQYVNLTLNAGLFAEHVYQHT